MLYLSFGGEVEFLVVSLCMRMDAICLNTCPFAKQISTVSTPNEDSCAALAKLQPAVCSYFHHDSFRPGQLEAMLPVMHGNDVFVKMPTGGGKTLYMFLPPLATM